MHLIVAAVLGFYSTSGFAAVVATPAADEEPWETYINRVMAKAENSVVPNAGVPTAIAGIALGKPGPDTQQGEFIGLPVSIQTSRDAEGRVQSLSLQFNFDRPVDGQDEKLRGLISRQVGFAPHEEYGHSVWRGKEGVLRFSFGNWGMEDHYFVVLHSTHPDVIGNEGDGFVAFLDSFSAVARQGSPSVISKFFRFPFVDERKTSKRLNCSSAQQFAKNFEQFRKQLNLASWPKGVKPKFKWPETYYFEMGTLDLYLRKGADGWKFSEIPYRE